MGIALAELYITAYIQGAKPQPQFTKLTAADPAVRLATALMFIVPAVVAYQVLCGPCILFPPPPPPPPRGGRPPVSPPSPARSPVHSSMDRRRACLSVSPAHLLIAHFLHGGPQLFSAARSCCAGGMDAARSAAAAARPLGNLFQIRSWYQGSRGQGVRCTTEQAGIYPGPPESAAVQQMPRRPSRCAPRCTLRAACLHVACLAAAGPWPQPVRCLLNHAEVQSRGVPRSGLRRHCPMPPQFGI